MSIVLLPSLEDSTQPILTANQYAINLFVLQELGLVVEPCLTEKN